jgi:membrane protein CcdC involved in cytochrome C biogenesis
MMDDIFQNVALSALYGVLVFWAARREVNERVALMMALVAFVVMLVTLWLIIDQELELETAVIVKSILWGSGLGLLGLFACLLLVPRLLQ